METSGIHLIIPAYNAEKHLPELLREVVEYIPPDQIILVDDGSVDRSGEVARSFRLKVVRHVENYGKGMALRSGIRLARESADFRAAIFMDADGQHAPASVPRFVREFELTGADLILGYRRRNAGGMPGIRRLSNFVTSFLISLRVAHSIRDSQCGYRLVSRNLADRVETDLDGSQAETELLIKAMDLRCSISQIRIPTIYGEETSHIKPLQDIVDFTMLCLRSFFYNL